MANVVKTVIMFRRGSTEEWIANKDVIPAAGEPCFDLELHTLKIGDGTRTYEQLPTIGGVDVSADNKSLVLEDNTFKLFNFDAAETGAQPRKNAEGKLEWVVPSTETLDGLQKIIAGLQKDVADIQEILTPSGEGAQTLLERVETLEGKVNGTGEGSIEQKIYDEVTAQINQFAEEVSADDTVNTFKELVDYVAEHGPEAANMAAAITSLQKLVGNTPVADQIANEITASEQKSATIFERIKYEISNKPAEALVDYRDKEIRILCPTDTQWELQNVGENGDASRYYVGFKAYAPNDNVVSFKEDLAKTITDETMYYFVDNEFAGIDVYGRKYSIVWLPVASYDKATATWTYAGINSSTSRYLGWYYSVEWYDANGKLVDSDTIRINLTNEACHNSIEPFYMGSVIKGISVGGILLDAIENKVNIPVGAGLQASDEITIAADGTLGLGQVSISKLVQNEDLVLDGGGAAN